MKAEALSLFEAGGWIGGVVFGGVLASVLAAFPLPDVLKGYGGLLLIFRRTNRIKPEQAAKLVELANLARMAGLLALEEATAALKDPFLKKGLLFVVDGVDGETIRSIMENEISSMAMRHAKVKAVWDFLANVTPAWGFAGAIVGCYPIWSQGADQDALFFKAAMTALAASLYGVVGAYLVAAPVAARIKALHQAEAARLRFTLETVLAIQSKEAPRVLEERLRSFLAPRDRSGVTMGA